MDERIINDLTLREFLSKNINDLGFLSNKTKKFIGDIVEYPIQEGNDDNEYCFEKIFNQNKTNTINILDFWESLLVDAIKFLKTNDISEVKREELLKPSVGGKHGSYKSDQSLLTTAQPFQAVPQGFTG